MRCAKREVWRNYSFERGITTKVNRTEIIIGMIFVQAKTGLKGEGSNVGSDLYNPTFLSKFRATAKQIICQKQSKESL